MATADRSVLSVPGTSGGSPSSGGTQRRPSLAAAPPPTPPAPEVTAAWEAEIRALQERVKSLTEQKIRESSDWERRCQRAEARIEQNERDASEIKAQHLADVSKLRAAHAAEINTIHQLHQEQVDKMTLAETATSAKHLLEVQHLLRQHEHEKQEMSEKVEELNLELKKAKNAEEAKNGVVEGLKAAREADEQKIHALEARLLAADKAVNEVKAAAAKDRAKSDEHVAALNSRINMLKTNVQQLYELRIDLDKKVSHLGKNSTGLQGQLNDKALIVENQDAVIAGLQARTAELFAVITDKTVESELLRRDNESLRRTAEQATDAAEKLQAQLEAERRTHEEQRGSLLAEWERRVADAEALREKLVQTETYRVEKETAEKWEKRCAEIERHLEVQMEHRKAAFELLTIEKEAEHAQKVKQYQLDLDSSFAERVRLFEAAVQRGDKNRFVELLQQRLDAQTRESQEVEHRWQRAMNELAQKLNDCLARNEELQRLLSETAARLRDERRKMEEELADRVKMATHQVTLKAQLEMELKEKELRDATYAHREELDSQLLAVRQSFEVQIEQSKDQINELKMKLSVAEGVMETLSKDHTPEIMQQRKDAEINAMKTEHNLALESMRMAHSRELDQLRESLQVQHEHMQGMNIDKIRAKHKQDLEEEARFHREETKLLKERYESELKTLRTDATSRVNNLNKELELVKMAQEVETRLLKKSFDQEKREMQSQISYLEDFAARCEQQSKAFKQDALAFEVAFEKRMMDFSDELRAKFSGEAQEKIRAAQAALEAETAAKMAAVRHAFDEQIETLKNEHWRVRNELEDKVDDLNSKLLAADQRYLNREPRPEDVVLITNMRNRLMQLEEQMSKAQGNITTMSREIHHREDIFNRMFSQAVTYAPPSGTHHVGPPPKPTASPTKFEHAPEQASVTITIDPKSQRSTLGIFGSTALQGEDIAGVRVRSLSSSSGPPSVPPSHLNSRRSTLAGDLATTTVSAASSRRPSGQANHSKLSWTAAPTDVVSKTAGDLAVASSSGASRSPAPSGAPTSVYFDARGDGGDAIHSHSHSNSSNNNRRSSLGELAAAELGAIGTDKRFPVIQRPGTPPAGALERPMSPARLLDPLPHIAFGSPRAAPGVADARVNSSPSAAAHSPAKDVVSPQRQPGQPVN